MNITLQKAFQLLQNCSAIIIDDDLLVYPSLDEITGDPENEFMYVEWEEDNRIFDTKFKEGNNSQVKIVDNTMYLYDIDGEPCSFVLLVLVPMKIS